MHERSAWLALGAWLPAASRLLLLLILLIFLPVLLLCACSVGPPAVAPTPLAPGARATSAPGARATQTVTDMYGATVIVPTRVERIADGWPAHNSLLVTLGVANKLVATTPMVQAFPWFLRIDPAIASVPPVFGASVNSERLVQSKPDVVFHSQTDDSTVKSIRGLGLPLVQLYFTDFAQLEACFQLTGLVVGVMLLPARRGTSATWMPIWRRFAHRPARSRPRNAQAWSTWAACSHSWLTAGTQLSISGSTSLVGEMRRTTISSATARPSRSSRC